VAAARTVRSRSRTWAQDRSRERPEAGKTLTRGEDIRKQGRKRRGVSRPVRWVNFRNRRECPWKPPTEVGKERKPGGARRAYLVRIPSSHVSDLPFFWEAEVKKGRAKQGFFLNGAPAESAKLRRRTHSPHPQRCRDGPASKTGQPRHGGHQKKHAQGERLGARGR